ncbi:MAG: hypothetical protein PVJ34_00550 [Anaerolineae bacterium]
MSGIWDRVQAEVEAREGQKGMSPYDLLELPRAQRALMKKLLKSKTISLADAARELGQSEAEAEKTLGALVEKTYLIAFEKKGVRHYKLLLARKAGKELPFNIWDDLSQKLEG